MISPRLPGATLLTATLFLWASPCFAQAAGQIQPGTQVVVTEAAPVFLMPDPTRTPLRTLAAGATAVADRVQGDWVRITFTDPQYGPRTGWIERRFLKVGRAPDQPAPARPGQTPDLPGTRRPAPGTQAPRPPLRRGPTPSARVFGGGAIDRMFASRSFDAVTGSETVPAFGGGIQVADAWNRLFVEFAAEYSSIDGERVFVFDNQVFELGIPVEIKTLPVDLLAGWRVPLGRTGRIVPFAGGGLTLLRYEETSQFADDDENVREWHPGFVALGGVEARLIPNLHVRVDFRYRRVEDAIGERGVSAVFGESALGGTGVGVKVVFGR